MPSRCSESQLAAEAPGRASFAPPDLLEKSISPACRRPWLLLTTGRKPPLQRAGAAKIAQLQYAQPGRALCSPQLGLLASSGPYTLPGQMVTRRQRSCWAARAQACHSAATLALPGGQTVGVCVGGGSRGACLAWQGPCCALGSGLRGPRRIDESSTQTGTAHGSCAPHVKYGCPVRSASTFQSASL